MSTKSKKIVIFDDDEDIVSICQYILEEKGWDVYAFHDCKDAVQKVGNIMPGVILMDNWIPDDGGVATTQKLKAAESLKTIPVIYFSANSDLRALADTAGADNILAKPFDLDELERVVNITFKSHS